MGKIIYLLFAIILITNVLKPSQLKAQVNLDNVISNAVEKLQKNKNNEAAIQKIQSAYPEATIIDNLEIQKLINQKDNWPTIYNIYKQMDLRQEKVFSVLPLYLDGKEITFKKVDYKSKMLLAKENAGNFHYNLAKEFARKGEKKDFQMAFYQLDYAMDYLGELDSLIKFQEDCYQNGFYKVLIKCNVSDIEEIIATNTDGFWVKYYAKNNQEENYDFTLELNLKKFKLDNPRQDFSNNSVYYGDLEYVYTTYSQTRISTLSYGLNFKQNNSSISYFQPKAKNFIYKYINEYIEYKGELEFFPTDLLPLLYNHKKNIPEVDQMIEYTLNEFVEYICQRLFSLEPKILSPNKTKQNL